MTRIDTMKFFLKIALIAGLLTVPCTAAEPLVPKDWDPRAAGDRVMQRLICVTAPEVKGAHDAAIAFLGNRAYIAAELNDGQAGENPAWPDIYAAMSIVDLGTLKVEKTVVIARGTQMFENETLPPGACFVPRLLRLDERTLRCFFANEQPGKRQSQTWYLDFDAERGEFTNQIHRAQLQTAAGTFDMQPLHFHADAAAQGFTAPPKDYGLYAIDAFKTFGGRTYAVLNTFPGGQNALAVVNDRRDTFEVLGHYNRPHNLRMTESSINQLPDGTWMAICRQEGGNRNYIFTTSPDGRTWTSGEHRDYVPTGTNSKPTFDRFGDAYYLGWQEKTRVGGVSRSVFNLDVSRDGKTWERKYRFETEKSFQYPVFSEHNGTIWVCVTQGDSSPSRKERIMFGKLENVREFAAASE